MGCRGAATDPSRPIFDCVGVVKLISVHHSHTELPKSEGICFEWPVQYFRSLFFAQTKLGVTLRPFAFLFRNPTNGAGVKRFFLHEENSFTARLLSNFLRNLANGCRVSATFCSPKKEHSLCGHLPTLAIAPQSAAERGLVLSLRKRRGRGPN